jgi:GNAT superfamily N-acetyltransferase
MTGTMQFRDATAADAPLIAAIHVESWRGAYAHIMDPAYLAGPIEAERLATWERRLAAPEPHQRVIVAEAEGSAIGFTCLIGAADARWGTLVDNLHARPATKGMGVGSALLAEAARWSLAQWPDAGMHLFCYTGNIAARGFYLHRGGQVVEDLVKPGPDGRVLPEERIYWGAPGVLMR